MVSPKRDIDWVDDNASCGEAGGSSPNALSLSTGGVIVKEAADKCI